MPGAANRIFDDESVDERAMVVRALGSDGKNFLCSTNEQDFVAADMTNELVTIR